MTIGHTYGMAYKAELAQPPLLTSLIILQHHQHRPRSKRFHEPALLSGVTCDL